MLKKVLKSFSLISIFALTASVSLKSSINQNLEEKIFFENELEISSRSKINITKYSSEVKSFEVDLSKVDNSEMSIKEEILWAFAEKNSSIEELSNIVYSVLYDSPDSWKINNIDFSKPKEGEKIVYSSARIIAQPKNVLYMGSLSFNVTLRNGNIPTFPNSIYKYVNVWNSEIGSEIDSKTRWLATRGGWTSINALDFAPTVDAFIDKFTSLNLKFSISHEDNSRYGSGIFYNKEFSLSLKTDKIFKTANQKYSSSDLLSPQANIFNKISSGGEGVITKFSKNYSQNESHSAALVDFYSNKSGKIYFSLITVSGKYAHWGNSANVQAKVNGKMISITN